MVELVRVSIYARWSGGCDLRRGHGYQHLPYYTLQYTVFRPENMPTELLMTLYSYDQVQEGLAYYGSEGNNHYFLHYGLSNVRIMSPR